MNDTLLVVSKEAEVYQADKRSRHEYLQPRQCQMGGFAIGHGFISEVSE